MAFLVFCCSDVFCLLPFGVGSILLPVVQSHGSLLSTVQSPDLSGRAVLYTIVIVLVTSRVDAITSLLGSFACRSS